MRSVKHRLFFWYSLTIFVLLSIFALLFYSVMRTEFIDRSVTELDAIVLEIEEDFQKDGFLDPKELEKFYDFDELFFVIYNNKKVIAKSENLSNTRIKELQNSNEFILFEELEEHEYPDYILLEEEYIFLKENVSLNGEYVSVIVGTSVEFIEEIMNSFILYSVIYCVSLYIILLLAGYWLLHKTIKPLQTTLEEVNTIREKNNLSLRLKTLDTNDEFEHLIHSFNSFLDSIEASVENIKQFSSDASHELKTPLTVIQTQIELTKMQDASEQTYKEALKQIEKQQLYIYNIIQNLLTLSRMDKYKHLNESCLADDVIFEIVELYMPFIEEKKLSLELDIAQNIKLPLLEQHLSIIVKNLLENAIYYTPSGSIHIRLYKHANLVCLEVKDSGIGIDKNVQKKIYERFFRVDKARNIQEGGTGLGLAIVKKVCDTYGARIHLTSELNKGASFSIHFKR